MMGSLGPPQAWQVAAWQWPSDVPPRVRLMRAGAAGLPVGRGGRAAGGLRGDTAAALEREGAAALAREPGGRIVRAYACQLALDFSGPAPWQA